MQLSAEGLRDFCGQHSVNWYTADICVRGMCDHRMWTKECSSILLTNEPQYTCTTVTPTTLKCLENILNNLDRKIQLNKTQVVSATESVRRDEQVGGKDKKAHRGPFRTKKKKGCQCVYVSSFFKHNPKFPQQAFREARARAFKGLKIQQCWPSMHFTAGHSEHCGVWHNVFRQHNLSCDCDHH